MKIVVVGGGFGGIKTALLLSKHSGVHVTLISDRDHFVYYPSLYAVATGGAQRQSFVPLSEILQQTSVRLVIDTIEGYDSTRKLVRGRAKSYSFDRVVFSLGVVTSYFGIKGLAEHSFGIKSHDDIAMFRRHVHDELTATRRLDKQYVVVGAGPTGVELASSLAQYIDHIARAHAIRHSRIRIKLVEAAPRILPRMSESFSRRVMTRLQAIGVSVMTEEKVEWQDSDEVFVSGKSIPTHTVVWTSGVANHPFFERHGNYFPLSSDKRVAVDEHLMVNSHTYVIGDNASTPYTGLAQTALHNAHFVARDIVRAHQGAHRSHYIPYQPPVVIPVGKRWALLNYRGFRVGGVVGHYVRRCADLIGYLDVLPIRLAIATWRSTSSPNDGDCSICRKKS